MKHALPPLPYDVAALEPHIDARTLRLHHGSHHAAYVEGLCRALARAPAALQAASAGWLLRNLGEVPTEIRTAVRNNAGGHVNHSLLWRSMTPGGGQPSGLLGDALDDAFGSARKFRQRFEEAGSALLGSGWVWLVIPPDRHDKLRLVTTSGHGNPMSEGAFPILVNDVWEHAYYLKHENRRDEYLTRWWAVVDWSAATRRLERGRVTLAPVRSRTDAATPAPQSAAA